MLSGRLVELRNSIETAFVSLTSPKYHFVTSRWGELQRHPFVADVMCRYFVKDETDLNNDLSLRLKVLHGERATAICLSFVAPWAVAFRFREQSSLYEALIEPTPPPTNADERELLRLLSHHGFQLLTKAEASTRLAMKLNSTEDEEVTFYHALVADEGCTLEVLR